MALLNAQPPAGGRRLLATHLAAALRANRRGGPVQGVPSVSPPQGVYGITAADISGGMPNGPDSVAKLESWRYFVHEDGAPVGIVLLGIADDGALHFAGFRRGPVTEGLIAAIHAAEALDRVRESDWELRGFHISELHVMGLWLHAPRFDLFLPVYAPPETGLQSLQAYSARALVDELRTHVDEVLQRPVLEEL